MNVRIVRDDFGIPTVHASDLDSLWFGQGRAVAEDRWWHLEWERRRLTGTMAELSGRPVDAVADGFARRCRLADAARQGFDELDDETQHMFRSHAAGINEVRDEILTGRRVRPVEFEHYDVAPAPWEGWHSVGAFLVRHVSFGTWQIKLWRARVLRSLGVDGLVRLSPAIGSGEADVIVPSGVRDALDRVDLESMLRASGYDTHALDELAPLGLGMNGSNAWAVDGTRSATGLPIVAGDPHRAIEVPGVYYQVKLRCPAEGIDADGFCFPGLPGVQHFAQTDHIAFAVTNAMADYQDVFIERLPDAVVDVRRETVYVRGGADIDVECATTSHGPVVVGEIADGIGLALASTGLTRPGGSLTTILPVMRARSVVELDAALVGWVEPVNNFLLADCDGNIGYRTAGRVPVRSEANHWVPVPGWVDSFDWRGAIPDDELPREFNPANGAIVTANQRVASADYRHALGPDVASPGRARRIWERLDEHQRAERRIDVAGMAAIHADDVVAAGRSFAARSGHPALAGWDGSMSAASVPAAVYAEARDHLVRLLVDRLPATVRTNPFRPWEPPVTSLPAALRVDTVLSAWIERDDRMFLLPGENWPALLHSSVDAAVDALTRRLGADRSAWRWGELHRVCPIHPLAKQLGDQVRPRSAPTGGGVDAVMATNNHPGISHDATVGSTARYVWDLSDRTRSGWVVPLGASGDPRSDHFADQSDAYVAGRLIPVR